jgi:Dyp-type peroxidase family
MTSDGTSTTATFEVPRISPTETKLELEDMQRLIVYGFSERPRTLYLLLRVVNAAKAKAWLRAQLPPLDPRRDPESRSHRVFRATRDRNQENAGVRLTLAFTYLGLKALGLDEETRESFVPAFRQGMTAPNRARTLGDEGDNGNGNWRWGQWGEDVRKEYQVHVLCAAYAQDADELKAWKLPSQSDGFHVFDRVYATLEEREPFGFRDGISQPYIKGCGRAAADVHARDRIEAGEFVFGYPNEFGQFSASPRVAKERAESHLLPPTVDSNFRDLGRNGTFLVVRELEQDVEKFHELPAEDAARAVGRWTDGTTLVLRPPDRENAIASTHPPQPPDLNDFTYFPEDAAGLRCPLGAHVRRANPRDALANPGGGVAPADAIGLANGHRLLRRSRVFVREDKCKGIFFQCLNTNLERQFEFVQQTWINNPKFGGPYEERDPVIGAFMRGERRSLTISAAPERKRLFDLHSYVRVRGGAYFFLPGIKALRYLGALP